MIILLLTIDSYSRNHFYRKLPKTAEYLTKLHQQKEHSVFDFKVHNIFGAASVENMGAIFSNSTEVDRLPKDSSAPIDFYGPTALWNKLRKLGFISVAAFENCDYRFA